MTKRDLPHWHLPSMLFHCIIDYTTNHIETLPIGINSHGIVDSGHALTSAAATPAVTNTTCTWNDESEVPNV
jgi:hypothetical protein